MDELFQVLPCKWYRLVTPLCYYFNDKKNTDDKKVPSIVAYLK